MKRFIMNDYLWRVVDVPSDSKVLYDRTGLLTVATTDPVTHSVYVSDKIHGSFKTKVLIHELAHCMMFSYGYIDEIRRMTYPKYNIEMEELIANMFASHLEEIYMIYYERVGDDAMFYLPYHINTMML